MTTLVTWGRTRDSSAGFGPENSRDRHRTVPRIMQGPPSGDELEMTVPGSAFVRRLLNGPVRLTRENDRRNRIIPKCGTTASKNNPIITTKSCLRTSVTFLQRQLLFAVFYSGRQILRRPRRDYSFGREEIFLRLRRDFPAAAKSFLRLQRSPYDCKEIHSAAKSFSDCCKDLPSFAESSPDISGDSFRISAADCLRCLQKCSSQIARGFSP